MSLRQTTIVFAFLALTATNAHAYIDPGTGSVVTTAILGFFAAIGYTFRKYFYRIKDMFSSKKTDDQRDIDSE